MYLKRGSNKFQNKFSIINNALKIKLFCLKPTLKVHEICKKVSRLSKVMEISLCTTGTKKVECKKTLIMKTFHFCMCQKGTNQN